MTIKTFWWSLNAPPEFDGSRPPPRKKIIVWINVSLPNHISRDLFSALKHFFQLYIAVEINIIASYSSFHGNFEPTTQLFIVAIVLSRLSRWVIDSTFFVLVTSWTTLRRQLIGLLAWTLIFLLTIEGFFLSFLTTYYTFLVKYLKKIVQGILLEWKI